MNEFFFFFRRDKERTGSGGGWAKLLFGTDFVFVKGVFVRTLVVGLVVSTKAPQLASLDDV